MHSLEVAKMSISHKITATNGEINEGSILLLFDEDDAMIVRCWSDTPKQALKRRKDHQARHLAVTSPPRGGRGEKFPLAVAPNSPLCDPGRDRVGVRFLPVSDL